MVRAWVGAGRRGASGLGRHVRRSRQNILARSYTPDAVSTPSCIMRTDTLYASSCVHNSLLLVGSVPCPAPGSSREATPRHAATISHNAVTYKVLFVYMRNALHSLQDESSSRYPKTKRAEWASAALSVVSNGRRPSLGHVT